MSEVVSFAPRVKAARERAGLCQRELSAAAGLSQSGISRIENGKIPTVPELIKIAAAIGTTIGALTGESPIRERLTRAAPTSDDDAADALTDRLAFYLEIDAHFEDLGYSTNVCATTSPHSPRPQVEHVPPDCLALHRHFVVAEGDEC